MNKKEIRIVYLGTPELSAKVLEKLIEEKYNIVGVVSQQDKPVGRKQIIMPTPVKSVALKHNIPVFQPEKIKNDFEFLYDLKPDILLTMAYGQIMPVEVLETAKIKALNLHGSLLPKYRGASPIQTALLEGEKETGVTLMEMVKAMDAGNMFYKSKFPILEDDNYTTLQDKIAEAGFDAFENGIDPIINDNYQGEPQNEEEVTFTKKIKPEDQQIVFNQKSDEIVNKIRALTIEPGAYFVFDNMKIKVLKAKVIEIKEATTPSKIVSYSKNGLLIETIDGVISLETLQKPGKKPTPIRDFYNGNQNFFTAGMIINA